MDKPIILPEATITAARLKLDRKTPGYIPISKNVYQNYTSGQYFLTDDQNNIIGYSEDPKAADPKFKNWDRYTGSLEDLGKIEDGIRQRKADINYFNQLAEQKKYRQLTGQEGIIPAIQKGRSNFTKGVGNFIMSSINLPNHAIMGIPRLLNEKYSMQDYGKGFNFSKFGDEVDQTIGLGDVLEVQNPYARFGLNFIGPYAIKPGWSVLKKGTKLARNQIAKTIVSENLRSNLNKTKIPAPTQNYKVIQFQSNPNYEILHPSDIKFKQLTGQLIPKRKSQLSLAERLGVPKAERNLIYSHPGEGTTTIAPENIYLINRSNESVHNFSKGKLVWKYPITYQGDSYRRFTNHWSFIEPVKSHMGGGWDTAPTTMLYPYKQAVYDNGFPANINIMDTYWANPKYFTLQGDKVRILTSDINQYNILKKQGVNVEFSKEGADLLKQIKQTSDQDKIQELATLHDKIHRNWTLKYTKDVDPNMYNKLAEEVDKAKLNYDGRPTSKIIEPDGSFHSAPPAHNHSLYGMDNDVVWHIGRDVPISKEEIPVLQRMVREGDLQVPTFESFKQNLRQIPKRDRNYYIRRRDLSEHPPYSHPHKDAINNAVEFIRFRESLSTYPKVIQKVFKKKQGGKIDFNIKQ